MNGWWTGPARVRAGRLAGLTLAVLALGGCATGGGGGGLVPTRAGRVAAGTAAADTASRALSPEATNPANAGADDVPVPPPTPVPAPGQVVGTTASGGRIMSRAPVPAVVDSGPSEAAREVLATIPDPIPPGERVPPPASVQQLYPVADATPGRTAGDSLAADSSARAPGDGDPAGTGGVPVPEPTLPLGQRRPDAIPTLPDSVVRAAADSAARAGAELPAGATPASSAARDAAPAAPAPAAPAAPDTCWRVQVAAPEEAERAEQLRGASESLLLVPMVIEKEQGLYKVRTRDCVSGATAVNLRARAENTGFEGAFRFVRKP